ncbi:MAG: hypothetical protein QF460_02230 [Candidatus Nanoarchaeia archaeon]|jgi:hypothetical protein|nr:hypothetical protein [Candidatus Nanoarchaeia archaeon]
MKKSVILSLFAILLVFSIPHILGYSTLENYAPCNTVANHDCPSQNAVVKEVVEGNLIAEDIQLYENKNINISPISILNPLLYSPFLLLIPLLGVNLAIIIAKTFFVAINFLLLFILGNMIFRNERFSILFSVAIVTQMIYKDLILMIFYLISLISAPISEKLLGLIGRNLSNLTIHAPLIFERVTRPNLTFILLMISSILLIKLMTTRDHTLKTKALIGLVWSSLFYSYFYNFVVFFITVAFLATFYLIKEKQIAYTLIQTTCFATLFSIPFWLNYLRFKNSDFYADYMARVAVEQGHFIRIIGDYIPWAIILATFLILRKNFKNEWVYFVTAFTLAGIAGLNLQLIAGFNPEPDHFSRLVVFGIEFILLSLIYLALTKTDSKIPKTIHKYINSKTIFTAIIIFLLITSAAWQFKYFENKKDILTIPSEEQEIYDWFRENVDENSVIMTDSLVINKNIPLYSDHNIYLGGGSGFTIGGVDELIDRSFTTFAILDYSKEEFEDELINELHILDIPKDELILRAHEIEDHGILNHIFYGRITVSEPKYVVKGYIDKDHNFSEKEINNYVKQYQRIKNNPKINYKLDYIVSERTPTETNQLKITEVFSNNKYKIYSTSIIA